MTQQIEMPADALASEIREGSLHEVAPDLAYLRTVIVNVIFVGRRGAGSRDWVLVDAGIAGSAAVIQRAVDRRYGTEARPRAIVMTHGHFDHVGALTELAQRWQVPIYAHPCERPYLDGSAAYPPPDPTVGGGLMALISPLYPTRPVDVGQFLVDLPEDGSIPPLPGWTAIHTPGHAAGHVSLWRPADRSLIAGDAFITTAQESAYAVAVQAPELHGPPRYLTPDWAQSKASVIKLASLAPELAITGHGRAMSGGALRHGLDLLAKHFDDVALPRHGRYVAEPS